MDGLLLQLKKPNASVAKLTFFSLVNSFDKLEFSEKDLHDDYELWNSPKLANYFVLFKEHNQKALIEDSFHDMQSTID